MSGLEALAAFSKGLGADSLLVQGPGGNISAKAGGLLHVKASGQWLARATTASFVTLRLDALRSRLRGAAGDPAIGDLVVAATVGMRPSIETGMHAAMPHAVVVHTHSVNALAHLVRQDAAAVLRPRLAGLRWRFVPYARPGMPLLRAIEAAGGVGSDVLLLANHGVVVGAADLESAGRLLAEVERRLRIAARDVQPGMTLPRHGGWRAARLGVAHGLGIDAVSRRLAGMGTFYPDHVVFLGPGGIASLPGTDENDPSPVVRMPQRGRIVLVPGCGALVRDDASEVEEEMARCLALTLSRVAAEASVRVLNAGEEAALTGWEAEAFRRRLDPVA